MALSARKKALLPGIAFMIIMAIVVLRFGAIILILTVLPSMLAYFLDHKPRKPMFKIIAACNISAALPFIVPIVAFSLKKHYHEAGKIVEDPMVWAYIYCAAGAGAGMLYLSKIVARIITLMHYDYSVKLLEKKQDMLVKEWGENITTVSGT